MSDDEYDEDYEGSAMDVDGADGPELALEGDICGDGSIMKEILRPGTGTTTATRGSKCTVHYVGTLLDGTKFDSSRDRNDPFKFTIGTGVITGWSEGVSTMKTGELAKFTIAGNKAYGERGSPPKIGPNATLVFEIELLDWTNLEDVSSKRDGSVMKSVVKKGEQYIKPQSLAKANITYHLTLVDGTVLKSAEEPVTVTVDDADLLAGFDDLIKSMRKGEVASFEIKAAKTSGPLSSIIPPGAAVKGSITLVDFTTVKNSWDMTDEEKFAYVEQTKADGNVFFKAGELEKAERRYKAALKIFSSTASLSEEAKARAEAANTALHLNTAATQIKLRRYRDGIQSCEEVLKVDSHNVKALYRKASALLDLGEWDDSLSVCKTVLEVEPGNKDAADLATKINALKAKQNEKDRKLYAKMFA